MSNTCDMSSSSVDVFIILFGFICKWNFHPYSFRALLLAITIALSIAKAIRARMFSVHSGISSDIHPSKVWNFPRHRMELAHWDSLDTLILTKIFEYLPFSDRFSASLVKTHRLHHSIYGQQNERNYAQVLFLHRRAVDGMTASNQLKYGIGWMLAITLFVTSTVHSIMIVHEHISAKLAITFKPFPSTWNIISVGCISFLCCCNGSPIRNTTNVQRRPGHWIGFGNSHWLFHVRTHAYLQIRMAWSFSALVVCSIVAYTGYIFIQLESFVYYHLLFTHRISCQCLDASLVAFAESHRISCNKFMRWTIRSKSFVGLHKRRIECQHEAFDTRQSYREPLCFDTNRNVF